MPGTRPSGTEGYADQTNALVWRYEGISFADAHAPVLQPPSVFAGPAA